MNTNKILIIKELLTYYELLEIEQPKETVKKLKEHINELEKKLKELI